jgi:hypothetical protein
VGTAQGMMILVLIGAAPINGLVAYFGQDPST